LSGGVGADSLNGGTGNDLMNGGAGLDVFLFAAGFGHDVITGFDSNPANGQDLLDLAALGINAANFGSAVVIAADGAHTSISIGADSILLLGVNAATLDASDFILGG
jgi:Ca2+-binding RTX toxin-like protein